MTTNVTVGQPVAFVSIAPPATPVRVVNGALVAGVATASLTARYQAVEVLNLGTHVMHAATNGVVPEAPWNDCVAVAPGERVRVGNDAAMWFQGQGDSNPGTVVNIAGTGTETFSVAGVG